jgi:hypothetical protein
MAGHPGPMQDLSASPESHHQKSHSDRAEARLSDAHETTVAPARSTTFGFEPERTLA